MIRTGTRYVSTLGVCVCVYMGGIAKPARSQPTDYRTDPDLLQDCYRA